MTGLVHSVQCLYTILIDRRIYQSQWNETNNDKVQFHRFNMQTQTVEKGNTIRSSFRMCVCIGNVNGMNNTHKKITLCIKNVLLNGS